MVKKAVVIILVLLVIVCAGAYILYQNRPEPEAQLTVYLEGYCGFYIMPDKTMEIIYGLEKNMEGEYVWIKKTRKNVVLSENDYDQIMSLMKELDKMMEWNYL